MALLQKHERERRDEERELTSRLMDVYAVSGSRENPRCSLCILLIVAEAAAGHGGCASDSDGDGRGGEARRKRSSGIDEQDGERLGGSVDRTESTI